MILGAIALIVGAVLCVYFGMIIERNDGDAPLGGFAVAMAVMCLFLGAAFYYDLGNSHFASADRLEVGAVYETVSAAKVDKGFAVVVKTEKGELIACVLPTEPPKIFTLIKKGDYVPVPQNPTKK